MNGKPFPTMESDEDAERFVAEADLSEYDWSNAKRLRLVFHDEEGRQVATVDLDPEDAAKAAKSAEAEGVPLNVLLGRVVHDWLERKAS
jgi:hypothetical protein